MNGDGAKWWGGFGLATAALVATDRTASRALQNSSVSQISFSKNVSKIGAVYTTLPITAALYIYGRKKDDAKAREVGVLGAEALLDAAIISQYPFDHAAQGETSLMMELCPESVDMDHLSTDKWYLEGARDASRELGATGVELILERMRQILQ